jgi:hypothetical protein
MKKLFDIQEDTKVYIDSFKDLFHKIGYDFNETSIPDLDMGLTIKIFQKNVNSKKSIYVVPWVRLIQSRPNAKTLANYPRLNIPKNLQNIQDSSKIKKLLKLCKEENLYFLVILPTYHGPYFWLEKYSTIPIEHWKLTYRKNPNNQDRIYLSNGNEYFEFVKKEELQKKLNKIFLL